MLATLPENLVIANTYLESNADITETARLLSVTTDHVLKVINTKAIKDYLNEIYLNAGYRNRNKLAELLDTMIEAKVQDAIETGFYTKADLLELMQFAHKLRMDEIKTQQGPSQTNVQINNEFGSGNYGELMKKLMK